MASSGSETGTPYFLRAFTISLMSLFVLARMAMSIGSIGTGDSSCLPLCTIIFDESSSFTLYAIASAALDLLPSLHSQCTRGGDWRVSSVKCGLRVIQSSLTLSSSLNGI